MKKLASILICAVMLAAVLLTSCNVVLPEDVPSNTKTPDATVSTDAFTEEELATPVITIGTHTVTLAEYIDFFNEIVAYYSNYGYDITSDPSQLGSYKELMTKALARDAMVQYRAEELGLADLTEEQLAEIEQNYEDDVKEMMDYYTELAMKEKESDENVNVDERVEKYILDEAQYYLGDDATVDGYYDYLHKKAHDDYIADLLK